MGSIFHWWSLEANCNESFPGRDVCEVVRYNWRCLRARKTASKCIRKPSGAFCLDIGGNQERDLVWQQNIQLTCLTLDCVEAFCVNPITQVRSPVNIPDLCLQHYHHILQQEPEMLWSIACSANLDRAEYNLAGGISAVWTVYSLVTKSLQWITAQHLSRW